MQQLPASAAIYGMPPPRGPVPPCAPFSSVGGSPPQRAPFAFAGGSPARLITPPFPADRRDLPPPITAPFRIDDDDDDLHPKARGSQCPPAIAFPVEKETPSRPAERAGHLVPPLWRGVECRGCGQAPLRGVRWLCLFCSGYNLCDWCWTQNAHDDATHFFACLTDPDMHRVPPAGEGRVHPGVTVMQPGPPLIRKGIP